MRVILAFVMLLGALWGSEYWSIDAYRAMHPDEHKRFEAFDAVVQAPPNPLTTPNQKPVVISLLYPERQLSDYWRRSKDAFVARLNALGIAYTLHEHFLESVDVEGQAQAIKKVLKEESDYLIFTLNAYEHQKLLSQIIASKKPKIMLQNITTPLKAWEGRQPFLYVGFDHVEGTKLLAEYFKARFPQKARYGMLYYSEGYVSLMRGDSFITMMPSQNYTLSGAFYTNGKSDKAKEAALKVLEKEPLVDFLYSCSTDVALGALEALKERDLVGRVLVNGWGGGSKELEKIQEGTLAVTVMRMNDDNGVAMAEAIKLDLLGEKMRVPQIYSGQFVLIDGNTSPSTLKVFEKRAFRYSGD